VCPFAGRFRRIGTGARARFKFGAELRELPANARRNVAHCSQKSGRGSGRLRYWKAVAKNLSMAEPACRDRKQKPRRFRRGLKFESL
jgi:hypothetical protein